MYYKEVAKRGIKGVITNLSSVSSFVGANQFPTKSGDPARTE